jgi:hypothetical protein
MKSFIVFGTVYTKQFITVPYLKNFLILFSNMDLEENIQFTFMLTYNRSQILGLL